MIMKTEMEERNSKALKDNPDFFKGMKFVPKKIKELFDSECSDMEFPTKIIFLDKNSEENIKGFLVIDYKGRVKTSFVDENTDVIMISNGILNYVNLLKAELIKNSDDNK